MRSKWREEPTAGASSAGTTTDESSTGGASVYRSAARKEGVQVAGREEAS